MNIRIAITAAAALAVAAVTITAASAAASASPTPTPTPRQATCSAFTAWTAHPSATRLDALMTASEHVAWNYLADDVNSLYIDERSSATPAEIASDIAYVASDCTLHHS
jgi:hypothetical protein